VQIARVRGDVVEAVGRDVGVAETAQVRDDHLEAGLGERCDHAPPDALRFRPAVDEQQRTGAAGILVDERLTEPADVRAMDGIPIRIDVGQDEKPFLFVFIFRVRVRCRPLSRSNRSTAQIPAAMLRMAATDRSMSSSVVRQFDTDKRM